MELEIIIIYVICCEFLQAMGHQEDKQCDMSDAEVMTTAIVAMLNFGGNYSQARKWLKNSQYIPTMLGKSRFSRRLNRIGHLFVPCFNLIGQYWKEVNEEDIYAIDTFPIPVCDNIRISRAKIYHDEAYRGYTASKRRYFYGLKVHIMVTQQGEPVEFSSHRAHSVMWPIWTNSTLIYRRAQPSMLIKSTMIIWLRTV